MQSQLYIPSAQDRGGDTWPWYENIPRELDLGFLAPDEREYLAAYYRGGGHLQPGRRHFFRRHCSETFSRAAAHLLGSTPAPRVIDLGCGSGTQTLYLALCGARVVALDLDRQALQVLRRRRAFYEQQVGRALDIEVLEANTLELDYQRWAPVNGVHSMFAFNLMKPARDLIARLAPAMAPGATFCVLDGNTLSWLPKVFPARRRPNVLSPVDMEAVLQGHGFEILYHRGGIVLPPACWQAWSYGAARRLDDLLGRAWLFPGSHQIIARKTGAGPGDVRP